MQQTFVVVRSTPRLGTLLSFRNTVRKLPAHSLVNIDPPYFAKGPELYTSFYRKEDHATLAEAVRAIKRPWILTYDDNRRSPRCTRGCPARGEV